MQTAFEDGFEEKVEQFFNKFNTKRLYNKKEVIIRADDDPLGVFYLKEGYARLYTVSPTGQELTLNIFKPGAYFSLMWAIGETKNTYFFEALTKIELLRAPKEALVEFVKEEPQVLFEMTKRILIGLDGLLGVMESLMFGNAYNKVATVLIVAAKRFGKKEESGQVIIDLPLTHQFIATLAGLTRETTSLVVKEFEKKGIIHCQRPFFVIGQMKSLEKEAALSRQQQAHPYVL
ncbi:MAG: Crp/Fnr family transcriptional regulator [Candidatus Daviesbacteria bacterium]|nr:MAG: Crp/Fnr family transcriptional regulator [Candidatus Daviesbacteria bacterium]